MPLPLMDAALHHWIEQFHQAPARCVLALTGGGAAAASALLQVPGGSRTILEIVVPYAEQALAEFLGQRPAHFCSAATSLDLARRAGARAAWLAPGEPALGLGCTASLASERPKRGAHRCHVTTVWRARVCTWSLTLAKGARNRQGEEALAAGLVLHALARTLGLPPPPPLPLLDDEAIVEEDADAGPFAALFEDGAPIHVALDGQVQLGRAWDRTAPSALLPGAFNPLHAAHLGLARAAEQLLGVPVVFELSVANVDKPDLPIAEVRRRLAQFAWRAPVWLTRAPKFVQKARLFPGAVFVVGADTALRVVAPRYYDNDTARMLGALELLRELGCRFLVACRADVDGRCLALADVPVPADYRSLFHELPVERFRLDLSSTELRARGYGV